MVSLDPTSCLADSLDRGRIVLRQSAVLAAALAVCLAWRVSPFHDPEPFVELLLVLGGCVLVIDLGVGWTAHRRSSAYADALILSGFGPGSRTTPIDRAVDRRSQWLGRPRTRHRLAGHLRWRLRLADGSLGLSPGYMRASLYPPLAAYERQALLANYALVRELADLVDRGPVDVRALVVLWSVVAAPPSLDEATGRAAGEALARRLRVAHGIIAPGEFPRPARELRTPARRVGAAKLRRPA